MYKPGEWIERVGAWLELLALLALAACAFGVWFALGWTVADVVRGWLR